MVSASVSESSRWPFTDNLLSSNALLNVETDDHRTILNPLVVHTNIMRYITIGERLEESISLAFTFLTILNKRSCKKMT